MSAFPGQMVGSGLLASCWVCLGGRSPAPLPGGKHKNCVCVCCDMWQLLSSGQVGPLTRAKVRWGWEPQSSGGVPDPGTGEQKRQLKVSNRTPVPKEGLRGRLTGLRKAGDWQQQLEQGKRAAGTAVRTGGLTLRCWLQLVRGGNGGKGGVAGRGGSLSCPGSAGGCLPAGVTPKSAESEAFGSCYRSRLRGESDNMSG